MFKQQVQLIDGKRYIVLESRFLRDWDVVNETKHTVTESEAMEICEYWIKYNEVTPEQLKIVEVPDILKK